MAGPDRPASEGAPVSEEQTMQTSGPRGPIGRLRHALRPTPGRRRFLTRFGVAALVVIVFALVPGYYALQPGFLTRYPNLAAPYKSWAASPKHSKVACQSCHVAPGLPSQAVYDARMLGEFYLSFVMPGRQLDVFAKPTSAACAKCHVNLISVSPSGDLIIPHRAHTDVLKIECVRCHSNLVHHKNAAGKDIPVMATCLTCHDGKQAKNACATCHTAKATPESHRAANWDTIHPTQVGKVDCASCHAWTANWCADCHSRRPASHTATWRTDHPQAVKVHRNCEVCHTGAFCITCHGDVPKLDFNPALKLVQ
jgi:hypothetical protein